VKITEQSICGSGGTDLCKIGSIGPGGGFIFFVDNYDQYTGFNYLEAAPQSCEGTKAWSTDVNNSLSAATGWAAKKVGVGQANTTAMLTERALLSGGRAVDTTGAAYFADTLASGVPGGCVTSKTDWFLGSIGEMELVWTNLQGIGAFSVSTTAYWSSTEKEASVAFYKDFVQGTTSWNNKTGVISVRPIRAF